MWLELGGRVSWWAFQTSLPLPASLPLIICSVNWYHSANPSNYAHSATRYSCSSQDMYTHIPLEWDCTPSLILNVSIMPCWGMAAPSGMPAGSQCQPLQALWLTQVCFSLRQCTAHRLTAGISQRWQPASPGSQVTMLSSLTAEQGYSKSSWVLSGIFYAPKQEGRIQPP